MRKYSGIALRDQSLKFYLMSAKEIMYHLKASTLCNIVIVNAL